MEPIDKNYYESLDGVDILNECWVIQAADVPDFAVRLGVDVSALIFALQRFDVGTRMEDDA